MSKAQSKADSDDSNEFVDRFKDAFPFVDRADEHMLHEDRIDGKAWVSDSKVLLVTPEATKYGYCEFDEFTDAEYVETRSTEENRGYVFTAGDYEVLANVTYVRTLANHVFDVSYDTMKRHAKTVDNADYDGLPEGASMIMFDLPDMDLRVVIAPLVSR